MSDNENNVLGETIYDEIQQDRIMPNESEAPQVAEAAAGNDKEGGNQ